MTKLRCSQVVAIFGFVSACFPNITIANTAMSPIAKAPANLTIKQQIPLTLIRQNAGLQEAAIHWTSLGTLQFIKLNGETPSITPDLKLGDQFVVAGPLRWRITPHGLQVVDQRKGIVADTPLLTDRMVRPSEVVYSDTLGSVFFYGDDLYRYHLASHTIERASMQAFGVIRKLIPTTAGLWIVAEGGVYLLEDHGMKLNKIVHPLIANDSFLKAATSDNGIWVATNDAQLIRIILRTRSQVELIKSNRLAIGRPAEMIYKSPTLWLLASNNNGDSYALAFVEAPDYRLNVVTGKYFSLLQKDNLLWAANHSTMLTIDPMKNSASQISMTEPGLLSRSARAKSVLFVGSSYGYKDNCEIVERGRLDLSKGWLNPLAPLGDHF